MSIWNHSSITVGLKHWMQSKHATRVRRMCVAMLGCPVYDTPFAGRKTDL